MRLRISILIVTGVIAAAVVTPIVAAALRDGAVVTNSGSTNTPGYIMKIRSDGSGSVLPNRSVQNAMPRRFSIPPALAQSFLTHAGATKLANPAAAGATGCMKSASFGYTLTVTYHGWRSRDLTCPGGGPEAEALLQDIKAIEQAANISTGVRRIYLPPN
ncbi:MAG: hypothetical protein JO165_01230, partial [Candidatus Eremiobacteraeota bacterium]|nr:hypothetical protein [Candidatus Eremiobacteraeota bacterium]